MKNTMFFCWLKSEENSSNKNTFDENILLLVKLFILLIKFNLKLWKKL